MKGKFRLMWRVGLVLVLALSLSLVMAVPVLAAALATPTLVLSSYVAAGEDVQHTISFDLGVSLGISDKITIDFDNLYASPATVADDEVTLDGVGILGSAVAINTTEDTWVITLAAPISTATNPVVVVITSAAHLDNPVAGTTYTLSVATTAETATSTASYTIIALPVVDGVKPAAGNVGDTMWVEVAGSDFTGTADTNVSTTTLDFGGGITVGSTKYVSDTEIDVQITVTAAGAARYVIPTSTAGEGTNTTADFDPNAAGTPQVDVWDAYDLTADPFVTGTLDPRADPMSYATITLAEAACDLTETVIVHAATYVEGVVIDESITLQSLDGAATTIIDASGASTVGIDITAAGVTLNGFTVALDGMVNGIRIAAGGVTVKNSVINDSLLGILVVGGTSTCMISDNHITDSGGQQPAGIVIQGGASGDATTAITIKGNTFNGNISCGIHILSDPDIYFENILIEGNTITGGDPYGIETDENLIFAGVKIIKNDITGSWEDGIRIQSWDTTSVIKYNNLYGNGLYGSSCGGLKNRKDKSNLDVDAKYNWWGEIGGPSAGTGTYAGTALGNGDIVSKDVTYDPWLTEKQAKTVTDGIAYFGSIITLEPGWNTLSVPLELKGSANTLTEIATLGDFLTDTNWEIAYQYNPALPGWENIGTSAIELVPGRGYYIKILGTADVNFPVLYSGQLGLPTYDLTTTGWNLIGSMFGIDAADDYGIAALESTDGEMQVLTALDSIKANTSVVVSPYLPGQLGAFGTTSEGHEWMQVGEAYWVFMEATDILAGFEVTPIYWIAP